jgi:hypothetical protein
MHIALFTTFAASRKEPLADMLARVHSVIVASGADEPNVLFVLSDSPIGRVSSIDRALKRFPELRAVERNTEPQLGIPSIRVLSNRPNLGGAGEVISFSTLLEVARGVPKSFPFHNVSLHFAMPLLSDGAALLPMTGGHEPGITITDSWWVSGRQRSLFALSVVDAEPSAKNLPKLPDDVAAILAGCGKVKKTVQLPISDLVPAAQRPAPPAAGQAIQAIMHDYRGKLAEIIERARMPHDLPSMQEALASTQLGLTAGPKKPELVRVFAPLGYDCRGESGTFTLHRRTSKNLTAELYLDVGTWSNSVTAIFSVQGLVDGRSFQAPLNLPVAPRAMAGGQYPIGDAERWRKIVENLAALVIELEQSFVPAIGEAAGPTPEWFRADA